jgi:hypothetical protein
VIVDECHHVPAVSFERVLAEVKARYVAGLTATPQRRDGQHPITEMQLGPVRFTVDSKSDAARRPFEHRLVVRETAFRDADRSRTPSIQELYTYVDREVPVLLRMFGRRLRGYRAIGYARGEAPLGFGEPSEGVVVDYDAED